MSEPKSNSTEEHGPIWDAEKRENYLICLVGVLIFSLPIIVGWAINKEPETRYIFVERKNPEAANTKQAAEWLGEVAAMQDSDSRRVFISTLAAAISDGIISNEEHQELADIRSTLD